MSIFLNLIKRIIYLECGINIGDGIAGVGNIDVDAAAASGCRKFRR